MATLGDDGDGPPEARSSAPSVVIVGDELPVEALARLFESWRWPVVATAADDLAGLQLVRRLRPELLVVHASGAGRFGDLDLARARLPKTSIVTLVDVPQQLTADRGAVLSGLPASTLRDRLETVIAGADGDDATRP